MFFFRRSLINFLYINSIFFVFALSLFKTSIAQNTPVGSWVTVNGEFKLNNKWSLILEPVVYSQKLYNYFYFYDLKGLIGYKITHHATVALGAGRQETYQPDGNFELPVRSKEFRVFERFLFYRKIRQLKIDNRAQLEQRFTGALYRNRFRYRVNLSIPINKPSSEEKALFLYTYDELFLTDLSPHISGNWIYAGAGFRVTKTIALQAGFARQYNYTNAGTIHKDYIVTSFSFSQNKKSKPENL